jgi:GDP-L-fucose synthase
MISGAEKSGHELLHRFGTVIQSNAVKKKRSFWVLAASRREIAADVLGKYLPNGRQTGPNEWAWISEGDKLDKGSYSLAGKKVWVAGHRGMAGSAIVRRLGRENCEILTVDRTQLDLRRQEAVESWMGREKPDAVFVAAGLVGGILANSTRPGEFLYDNMQIEFNVIHTARLIGVEKLLFLGSSCIYPREAAQPMSEGALLTGPLEPTNEWYAIAKISGIKLCEAYRTQYGCDFISAMPTNLYGIGDNFDLKNGHVAAALIAKFHRAKVENQPTVELWGSGKPLREFLYADDLADGLVFLMKHYSGASHVNVGTGNEISILELANLLKEIVGYEGKLVFDASKPDGMMRKVMQVDKLATMGWKASTPVEEGFRLAYNWYVDNLDQVRR